MTQGLKYDASPKRTTSEKKKFEGIPEDVLSKMVNPGAAAFENALNDFLEKKDVQILKDVHFILMMDGSQYNEKIMRRLPELFEFLKEEKYYASLMLILGDISHYNKVVQDILTDNDIFKYLDYQNKATYEFLFNFLDKNERGLEIMKKEFYDVTKHERINKLF
ncbi:hypothetical protein EHP00_1269 [Ecytonucleospora hepatopenaei]|uniref:Uncharacterized protein n=1 Tax=Ecytonucleospora hepatopenaei TaxID=646526 RepID=A0A1W0E693_9MICR|nr:hypothetical protein EHP00_1269 [Ecytonucleospora hepatopenaei]